ncbi:hypothetical protein ACFFJY_17785 [Fictibacillus aquaticus]|uniref:VOC domain-containing protein n=1 Tax=Fictibacillus aquaticus TaxID=2021314 RepID=A0A235F7E3_9BACL|nr:hypothetical protein [Fictibacillus aquaticus]OYD56605.1 hypothetical protein CGZ90_16465 [Fictibacillus aquaticus]
MLFHYHFWTPHVEETEKFYVNQGFRISLRNGKYNGEFQTFNPPLAWDDFRDKEIKFRIIEARKGAVNITFGYGKKVIFDHIGFLVSPAEYQQICKNAEDLNWKIDGGERRTFIATPYGFRVELQTHGDAIDGTVEEAELKELLLTVKKPEMKRDLNDLFGRDVPLTAVVGDTVTVNEAVMTGMKVTSIHDPNGVMIAIKSESPSA